MNCAVASDHRGRISTVRNNITSTASLLANTDRSLKFITGNKTYAVIRRHAKAVRASTVLATYLTSSACGKKASVLPVMIRRECVYQTGFEFQYSSEKNRQILKQDDFQEIRHVSTRPTRGNRNLSFPMPQIESVVLPGSSYLQQRH